MTCDQRRRRRRVPGAEEEKEEEEEEEEEEVKLSPGDTARCKVTERTVCK